MRSIQEYFWYGAMDFELSGKIIHVEQVPNVGVVMFYESSMEGRYTRYRVYDRYSSIDGVHEHVASFFYQDFRQFRHIYEVR